MTPEHFNIAGPQPTLQLVLTHNNQYRQRQDAAEAQAGNVRKADVYEMDVDDNNDIPSDIDITKLPWDGELLQALLSIDSRI
jgi:hypothetical protein